MIKEEECGVAFTFLEQLGSAANDFFAPRTGLSFFPGAWRGRSHLHACARLWEDGGRGVNGWIIVRNSMIYLCVLFDASVHMIARRVRVRRAGGAEARGKRRLRGGARQASGAGRLPRRAAGSSGGRRRRRSPPPPAPFLKGWRGIICGQCSA